MGFHSNRYYEANSFYEMAHFRVFDYGVHNSTGEGGGFLNMFATSKAISHGLYP